MPRVQAALNRAPAILVHERTAPCGLVASVYQPAVGGASTIRRHCGTQKRSADSCVNSSKKRTMPIGVMRFRRIALPKSKPSAAKSALLCVAARQARPAGSCVPGADACE